MSREYNHRADVWCRKTLVGLGQVLVSEQYERIVDTPWSWVVRYQTQKGYYYLKQVPEKIAIEAHIINLINNYCSSAAPVIIATNPELYCFVMQDAGPSIREQLFKKFDVSLALQGIEHFKGVQQVMSFHVDEMLALGVPDYRLVCMPDLFLQLLERHSDVLYEDGLHQHELDQLKVCLPRIKNWCHELNGLGMASTLVQPDCNDNNLLLDPDTGKVTLIDIGEITVSNPLFSLLNFMYVVKRKHTLADDDPGYLSIKRGCLSEFANLAEQDQERVLACAYGLYPVYAALAGYRLIEMCDKQALMTLQRGKLSDTLRQLL